MGLKELFGLVDDDISEVEIMRVIKEARHENRDFVEIKGVRVNIQKSQYFECGIMD